MFKKYLFIVEGITNVGGIYEHRNSVEKYLVSRQRLFLPVLEGGLERTK